MTATPSFSSALPRRRLTPQDARRRTIRVKTTRLVFLGGAALSTLLLVGSVILRGVQGAAIDTTNLVQNDQYVIASPEFIGNTKDGKRLKVTGTKATRSVANAAGAVRLEKPRMETSDGSVATADEGSWQQETQTLTLKGNVVFSRKGGERATGLTAVWTADPSILKLDGASQVTLPSGEQASAQTLEWDEAKASVALAGSVRVVFNGGEATSDRAFFDQNTRILTGSGAAKIRAELGTGAADRYEYHTVSRRLRLTGKVVATLN